MKYSQIMLLMVLVAVIVLVGGMVNLTAQNRIGAEPTVVAVINIVAVANKLKQREDMLAEITVLADEAVKWEEVVTGKLKSLQSDLEVLNEGSSEYINVIKDLEKKTFEYQMQSSWRNQQLQREQMYRSRLLERMITKAIEQISEQEGYDLVMRMNKAVLPKLKDQQMQQLAGALNTSWVFYASDKIDITEAVIQKMNSEYAGGSGASN